MTQRKVTDLKVGKKKKAFLLGAHASLRAGREAFKKPQRANSS